MRKFSMWSTLAVSALTLMASLGTAQAQATGTWVSGVGDDANPCSRTAPCKTFAGAISKTASGGEIRVLDPGGFGAVTITKSITINGDGTLATMLNAGSNGVILNAAGIKVILRNLTINGGGTGVNGVHFVQGAELTCDRCVISGQTGNGINVAVGANANVFVTNSVFEQGAKGINLNATAGFAVASVSDSRFYGATNAAVGTTSNSTFIQVTNSTIMRNGLAALTSGGNGTISIVNSLVAHNATGFNASTSGSTIRLSRNVIFDNANTFLINAGATIASDGENVVANNGPGAPNATLTKQ